MLMSSFVVVIVIVVAAAAAYAECLATNWAATPTARPSACAAIARRNCRWQLILDKTPLPLV